MTPVDIILLVVTSVVGALLIILALFFFYGRGANLIAGYNTMSEAKKASVDTKKLTRFAGVLMLVIGVLTVLLGVFGISYGLWAPLIYGVVVILLTVVAIIYANTKQRFKIKVEHNRENL